MPSWGHGSGGDGAAAGDDVAAAVDVCSGAGEDAGGEAEV